MNWFKKLFSSFWGLFRKGLDKFLADNIEQAKVQLYDKWVEFGRPVNLNSFKTQIFPFFADFFKQSKGTWVSILIDLAWDSLKKTIEDE